ncbi:hypothetical protein HY310_01870 [Candidatus Microgenomates bacterium]|nr:hypothetical protein [Candidatus Microgenomates bacterium]
MGTESRDVLFLGPTLSGGKVVFAEAVRREYVNQNSDAGVGVINPYDLRQGGPVLYGYGVLARTAYYFAPRIGLVQKLYHGVREKSKGGLGSSVAVDKRFFWDNETVNILNHAVLAPRKHWPGSNRTFVLYPDPNSNEGAVVNHGGAIVCVSSSGIADAYIRKGQPSDHIRVVGFLTPPEVRCKDAFERRCKVIQNQQPPTIGMGFTRQFPDDQVKFCFNSIKDERLIGKLRNGEARLVVTAYDNHELAARLVIALEQKGLNVLCGSRLNSSNWQAAVVVGKDNADGMDAFLKAVPWFDVIFSMPCERMWTQWMPIFNLLALNPNSLATEEMFRRHNLAVPYREVSKLGMVEVLDKWLGLRRHELLEKIARSRRVLPSDNGAAVVSELIGEARKQ